MTSSKDILLPEQTSYSDLPEYVEHVENIVASYESPDGMMGELVRQLADAMWWIKTYQKDKDHLIVMKMATCLFRHQTRPQTLPLLMCTSPLNYTPTRKR
jgi:hypothetical protein